MVTPAKIVQVTNSSLNRVPSAPATATNGVKYPDQHPALGQFVKW